MKIKNYIKATSLEEAWELNQKRSAKVIGGNLWVRMGKGSIQTAIDLSELGLDKIEETLDEFSFGAYVRLRDMELHEGFGAYTCGAAREAVRHIVGVQFRNLATVGGSVYGRFGFSDVLTLFLAMDSYVELYKGGIVPLSEFVKMKYDNDILVRVIVKKTPAKFCYQSVRPAKTDFPTLAMCHAYYEGAQEPWKVAVGARSGKARLYTDEKRVLADGITEESAGEFARQLKSVVPTSGNYMGSAEYRSLLVETLAKRGVKKLGGVK